MNITPLGKIAPTAAGTPVQVTADNTIRTFKIYMAQIAGTTGKVYVGRQGLVKGTLAGVIKEFAIPAAGLLDVFVIESESGEQLVPADYWVDADVNNEGVLVSYQQ